MPNTPITTVTNEVTNGTIVTNNITPGTWGLPETPTGRDSYIQINPKINQHPSLCKVGSKIMLKTFKGSASNPQLVKEEYTIKTKFTGSYVNCGNKINYIPIGTSGYVLKIYEPDPFSTTEYNMVYCIPAIKNNLYETGYQDCTTSVPQEFKNAFVQYASAGRTQISSTLQKISFLFEFTGNLSSAGAMQGTSQTFTFEFAYNAGNTIVSDTATRTSL